MSLSDGVHLETFHWWDLGSPRLSQSQGEPGSPEMCDTHSHQPLSGQLYSGLIQESKTGFLSQRKLTLRTVASMECQVLLEELAFIPNTISHTQDASLIQACSTTNWHSFASERLTLSLSTDTISAPGYHPGNNEIKLKEPSY